MRRFLSPVAVACLLGLALPAAPGAEAWAQGRGRSPRSAKNSKARKPDKPAATVTDPVTGEASSTATGATPTRGPARIDFDDRLIQGQTNKSGAVYLYDRKELKTRSMIRERDSFRSEILSTLYDP
jgi:hypothetical protein